MEADLLLLVWLLLITSSLGLGLPHYQLGIKTPHLESCCPQIALTVGWASGVCPKFSPSHCSLRAPLSWFPVQTGHFKYSVAICEPFLEYHSHFTDEESEAQRGHTASGRNNWDQLKNQLVCDFIVWEGTLIAPWKCMERVFCFCF